MQHATHGGVSAAESARTAVVRLPHDQKGQVISDRHAEAVDEILRGNAELQALIAFGVGALFEHVAGNPRHTSDGGAGAKRQGEVWIAIVVDRDDALTAVGHHPRQRAGDGRLPGATLACDRDLHTSPPPREVATVSDLRGRMASSGGCQRGLAVAAARGLLRRLHPLRASCWFSIKVREVIRLPSCVAVASLNSLRSSYCCAPW